MNVTPAHWFVQRFRKLVQSIAFLPAFIAFVFLLLSFLMLHLDFSDTGKSIKATMTWLRLKDASTARTIVSVIAAGILSLTVFSFTMVMVVLNQAASQMSNRVLDQLIGNRYQQIVLGIYVGTIVYSLFLLSSIRDIDSGIYVPSLSTYLLIGFAIVSIFLFIYFLHYITQSVKYAVIIRRIGHQTEKALKHSCRLSAEPETVWLDGDELLLAHANGVFNGFQREGLLQHLQTHNATLQFLHPIGTHLLKDTPLARLQLTDEQGFNKDELKTWILIGPDIDLQTNFYYGFRQLTEVALRALSPGINDPGTAVESLRGLTQLLAYRLRHYPNNAVHDKQGALRIGTVELSVEEIFNRCMLPIWDYGKDDRLLQWEMQHLLTQLSLVMPHPAISRLLNKVVAHSKTQDIG